MKRSRLRFRLFTRVAATSVAVILLTLIAVQFAHIIGRNIAMARSLHQIQADVLTLRLRKRQQERELSRLNDPSGSIPEIHDRLHLTTSHEAIIYLKRGRLPTP